jgi:hypothetical protein
VSWNATCGDPSAYAEVAISRAIKPKNPARRAATIDELGSDDHGLRSRKLCKGVRMKIRGAGLNARIRPDRGGPSRSRCPGRSGRGG